MMATVRTLKVMHVADLSVDDNGGVLFVASGLGLRLAAVEYVVEDPPRSTDYRGLIDACCDAASHGINKLFAKGYRAWLLLIGPALSADERKRFPNRGPNRGFGKSLPEHGLLNDTMIED